MGSQRVRHDWATFTFPFWGYQVVLTLLSSGRSCFPVLCFYLWKVRKDWKDPENSCSRLWRQCLWVWCECYRLTEGQVCGRRGPRGSASSLEHLVVGRLSSVWCWQKGGKSPFSLFLLNNSVVLGVMRNVHLLRKECVNLLVSSSSADSLVVSLNPFGSLFKSFAVGRVLWWDVSRAPQVLGGVPPPVGSAWHHLKTSCPPSLKCHPARSSWLVPMWMLLSMLLRCCVCLGLLEAPFCFPSSPFFWSL